VVQDGKLPNGKVTQQYMEQNTIKKRYTFKELYTVKKRYGTEQYIIAMVLNHNEMDVC
jgi:hypothetical protein